MKSIINTLETRINAFLIVFMIALTNFTNIISYYTNINVLLINTIFMFGALFVSLINNKFHINRNILYITILLIIYFFLNIILVHDYMDLVISDFGKVAVYGVSALFISGCNYNLKYLKLYWYKISILLFIILLFMLPDIVNRNFNYMHAGFIINFIMIGFIFKFLENRKKVWIVFIAGLVVISLLFGHRGSLLVNLVLIIYILYESKLITIKNILIITPILIITILILLRFNLLTTIYDSLVSQMEFLNSYSLRKILLDLENGTIDLSGRESYYNISWNLIKDNYFIIPNGLGKFQYAAGLLFPHNIFLDIYLIFGVFSLIIFAFLIKSLINVLHKKNNDFQDVYMCIYIYSIIRLLTGGTFLTEPSFWVLIGISFNQKLHIMTSIEEATIK